MIVLSGDHPFECEFCGSCFRDDGTLRGHKRIHTGEKPYECNGCGKRFSLKHQLETHYRVHTGESSGRRTCQKCWREGILTPKKSNVQMHLCAVSHDTRVHHQQTKCLCRDSLWYFRTCCLLENVDDWFCLNQCI